MILDGMPIPEASRDLAESRKCIGKSSRGHGLYTLAEFGSPHRRDRVNVETLDEEERIAFDAMNHWSDAPDATDPAFERFARFGRWTGNSVVSSIGAFYHLMAGVPRDTGALERLTAAMIRYNAWLGAGAARRRRVAASGGNGRLALKHLAEWVSRFILKGRADPSAGCPASSPPPPTTPPPTRAAAAGFEA